MSSPPLQGIGFRPVRAEDSEFLCRVYASTRAEELAVVPWSEEQKVAFLRMQFQAQAEHYARYYPSAQFLVILRGEVPVGRLYVHRQSHDMRIVDIALLPEHRGAGIGGAILADLLAEGRKQGVKVSIHVERNNRAMRLYERLGFERVSENGIYFLMERRPD